MLDKLRQVVEHCIEDPQVFIVNIDFKATPPHNLTVIIDGDEGVTIRTCADLSRKVGEALEETPLFEGAYLLEVTSPGAEEALSLLRQYPQHIGRKLRILQTDGKERKGKLQSIEGENLHITEEYEVVEGKSKKPKVKFKPAQIAFQNIDKSFVELSFK
ncbi:MAG: ribosome maturation factor RimP [Bernardetiaceae bacterium]|nr:ribosome maturation factor RimP [Bernardetiaceae bacterium]